MYNLFPADKGSSARSVASAKVKKNVYEQIEKEMSGTGKVMRSATEIKRKKECWFSSVKKKVSNKFQ